ncbi:hypothetical protein NKI71_24205 [Mesorhizobium sp. M0510]|uniref:ATP-dependent DNA ligase n=1 Tax=unclassified Mesorhizobium TaxID=325217 RepID=UPI003339FBE6
MSIRNAHLAALFILLGTILAKADLIMGVGLFMRLKFIKPMEPELVDHPPEGGDWIHEIKFDGYRTQLIKDEDGIRLLTRRGYNWTARYKVLADQAAAIEADDFIIEGEAIVVDEA